MIRPDLIIFDCDGVLVDSEVLSCRCLSEVLAGYGISLGLDQALDLFLGRSVTAVSRALSKHWDARFPSNSAAELRTGVRAAFLSALCPIEGVSSVLEGSADPALRRLVQRCRSGVLLAFPDRSRAAFRHAASIPRRWWNTASPRPTSSSTRPKGCSADPRRTLVIEDSVSGVKAGKAAGMTVWGFVGGSHYQSRDGKAILREAGADRVFERMADFWPNGSEAT